MGVVISGVSGLNTEPKDLWSVAALGGVSGILSAVLTSAVVIWLMYVWSVCGLNTELQDLWSVAALGVLLGFCLLC